MCHFKELSEIVSVASIGLLLVREIVLSSHPRDPGFQGTFDSIASQEVSTVMKSQIREALRLTKPNTRK